MARFVGEAVMLEGAVSGASASCALGRLPLARSTPDGPADVMVRPEQIVVGAASAEAPRARVVGVSFYGCDAMVRLALDGRAEPIACRVPGHRAPRPGDDVRLSVEGAVMAYPRARGETRLAPQRLPAPESVFTLGLEENLP
jgi:iron(III) transport system ATP-binding protein